MPEKIQLVNAPAEDEKLLGDKEWFQLCSFVQQDEFGKKFGWETRDNRNSVIGGKQAKS